MVIHYRRRREIQTPYKDHVYKMVIGTNANQPSFNIKKTKVTVKHKRW